MINYIKKNKNYLIFAFFIISFMCWFLEICFSLIDRGLFVLPGVWYGPYCPIYGLSYIIIIILTQNKENIVLNFLKIALVVSVMEYLISYISDVYFDNIIWDYSTEFLNLNGRICLEMSLLFTIFGMTFVYLIDPILCKIYNYASKEIDKFNIACLIFLFIDMVITLFVQKF